MPTGPRTHPRGPVSPPHRSRPVTCSIVLIVLPPSETKATGGHAAPLDTDRLWLPRLGAIRGRLIDDLVRLSQDPGAARRALGIGAGRDDLLAVNAALRDSPTLPAIHRYTGVLYDALDIGSMPRAARARAEQRLAIGSALFGVVAAGDLIPAYRLSAGSSLPGSPTLRARWSPDLAEALAEATKDRLVVDLRSGGYRQLGPIPEAVTVTVLTEHPDGSRTVVSHFNKHHKGLLARILAGSRAEPDSARAVAVIARRAGLRIEVAGPTELVVVTG